MDCIEIVGGAQWEVRLVHFNGEILNRSAMAFFVSELEYLTIRKRLVDTVAD